MTISIVLKCGVTTLIDASDFDLISRYTWHFNKRTRYACCNVGRNGYQIPVPFHKMLINAPHGMYIDHVNGDRLDNRRCNLRIVTPSMSRVNSAPKRTSLSGFKGVSWHKKMQKWHAVIGQVDKRVSLGFFSDVAEAARAYDAAALTLYGEFARLNFQAVPAQPQEPQGTVDDSFVWSTNRT